MIDNPCRQGSGKSICFEPFDLVDQYGSPFSMSDYEGKPFVIFAADRKSYLDINPWRDKLWEYLPDLSIIGLANTSPLTHHFKWVLPSILYEKPGGRIFRIFLDWRGVYFSKLAMKPEVVNFYVINKKKHIVFKYRMKKYEASKMQILLHTLEPVIHET